jgi:hypothetical protein
VWPLIDVVRSKAIECGNIETNDLMKNGVFWDVTPCGSCKNLQEPHGVTSQKTPFFIVTAVKTSNLTNDLIIDTVDERTDNCLM